MNKKAKFYCVKDRNNNRFVIKKMQPILNTIYSQRIVNQAFFTV